jgi:hypothetical protein
MWAEPTPAAPPASGGALALEALDEHGVVGDGRGVVDQPAQELIVGGGPDTELAPDRFLLGAGVPPPLPLEGEDATLPLPQRNTVRLPGWGWIWGGCGGRSPPQLCVVLHVLSPQFSGGRDPAASQGRRRRTPKILYLANHMRYMLGGASLDARLAAREQRIWRISQKRVQSGPFDHGMITGRTRFTVNGSADPPSEERARPPIPHRAQPVSGHWRREEGGRAFALVGRTTDPPPSLAAPRCS